MRRSRLALGMWQVLKEEADKLPAFMNYSGKEYGKVLTGENMTEDEKAYKEKHQQMYEKIQTDKAKKNADAGEARKQQLNAMPFAERMSEKLKDLQNTVAQATSKQAGVVALIDQCTASHAAEVAVEQGIDVQNVQVVLEESKVGGAVESGSRVVGYIDAPAASEEEIMAYAQKLEKACPAARMHGEILWKRAPSSSSSHGSPVGGNEEDMPRREEVSDAAPPGADTEGARATPPADDEGGLPNSGGEQSAEAAAGLFAGAGRRRRSFPGSTKRPSDKGADSQDPPKNPPNWKL